MKFNYTNSLINATSPYLLQHAHNPVNWQPWSNDIIKQSGENSRLILVSIGYAACHWCHVMEHESFEDIEVARIMNDNFICVKVDREERPDVDNYYMTAVQLMRQHGGWPLNVIALPDGRPVWGGTYFPKNSWIKNLLAIAEFYKNNKIQTEEYAANLQTGIEQVLLNIDSENVDAPTSEILKRGVEAWKRHFDLENGGRSGAPKFPMPVNLDFLLYYGFVKKDKSVLDFVKTTLEKMARGGIYDQIGGGFARYSVDDKWKVPHFEKMLYDNGQLLSSYSNGFRCFGNYEFKRVVYETVDFLERELTDESGAFYSSLDADSEGEEGKFYVWNLSQLRDVLKEDFDLFSDYFNVNSKGYWEHKNYILLRDGSDESFAEKNDISIATLHQYVSNGKNKLLKVRSKRIRPGLDDKTLTSWNALVIQGLTDAYKSFNDQRFLTLAVKNGNFLKNNLILENGKLFHCWKKGKASVNGFLEDYSLLIQAFISLFEITGDKKWLKTSIKLTDYTIVHFFDKKTTLFYFSEINSDSVLTNHFQKEDNIIPSANSVMANNLHKLYLLLGIPRYREISEKMVQQITSKFELHPMAYSNWGNLVLMKTEPYFEVVVLGENAKEIFSELNQNYHPNMICVFSKTESKMPMFKNRLQKDKTLIYVCREGVCQLPEVNIKQALKLVRADGTGK